MNALSLLALTLTASTGLASEANWLQLDQEIASLSTSAAQAQAVSVGAMMRTSYQDGGGVASTGGGGPELVFSDNVQGFLLEDVDLWLSGQLEEFAWRVSFDLDGGTLELEDALVRWAATDDLGVTLGRFKAPVLRSTAVDPNLMLFIDRTRLGATFDRWDSGVQVDGTLGDFGVLAAAQNGTDGTSDDLELLLRVTHSIGAGASAHEGALGAPDGLAATIGLSYDDMANDGIDAMVAADMALTDGALSGSFEYADGSDNVVGPGLGNTPWSLALGYLFADNLEAAWRYEDLDTTADEVVVTTGLNWYLHGHNAKWQANYVDRDGFDKVLAVSLTIGASR